MSATAGLFALAEQRKVFLSGVVVFIVYLLGVSGVFCLMTEWDLFTAFYFLFNSVALIGECIRVVHLQLFLSNFEMESIFVF